MKCAIQLSIVSHGQGRMLRRLLEDLAALDGQGALQLTLVENTPSSIPFAPADFPFPVRILRNVRPLGFSANHNHAFQAPPLPEQRRYFVVLNPDLRIGQDVFTPLAYALAEDASIGVIAPRVFDPEGRPEDSARLLPTPGRLVRKLFGNRGVWPADQSDTLQYPDWIAGMFMMFRAEVFERLGGFDEHYHLYYEDVDLCSRAWLNGWSVAVAPRLSVVHDAQRSSRRDLRYMRWHLASMLRFLTSRAYRDVRRLQGTRHAQIGG